MIPNDSKPKEKSRTISQIEYLNTLQNEYLEYAIRVKIYPMPDLKGKFLNTMAFKQKKIIDIANNYNIPTLFSDEKILQTYTENLIGKGGFPKFEYIATDKSQANKYWDFRNYYYSQTEVYIFFEKEEDKRGSVIYSSPRYNIVKCSFNRGICQSIFNPQRVSREISLFKEPKDAMNFINIKF